MVLAYNSYYLLIVIFIFHYSSSIYISKFYKEEFSSSLNNFCFSLLMYLCKMDLWILILFYRLEPNTIPIYFVVYTAVFSNRHSTVGDLDLRELRGIQETFYPVFTPYSLNTFTALTKI